ncbi:hypothetical protein [Actinoalloteichus spitiensis]|uniref:hypothetical protein n=1 Tax=Actinoalloteichus spitiensis TaxID=252394 RepID=UPI00035D2945|nr:hypothetical protein [Actinoalloteichus spitiensis]
MIVHVLNPAVVSVLTGCLALTVVVGLVASFRSAVEDHPRSQSLTTLFPGPTP